MVELGPWFQSPQRSIGISGGHSAIPEVIWAYYNADHLLGPSPAEVTGLNLVLYRFLALACSHECPWLRPSPVEVTSLAMVLLKFLVRPVPAEVAHLVGLLL